MFTGSDGGFLQRLVVAASNARFGVLVVMGVLALAAARYALEHLGINTDTDHMMSPELDWRQHDQAFSHAFPQLEDNLVVVVDGATREIAEHASRSLGAALLEYPQLIEGVSLGRLDPFFERHGLLFLDARSLSELSSSLVQVQPLIGRLAHEPTLRTVVTLLDEALDDSQRLAPQMFDRFAGALSRALNAVLAGEFHRMSWSALLDEKAVNEQYRELLLVRPVLDYSRLYPARNATSLIRQLAIDNGLVASAGVEVRITGAPAMSEEELDAVSRGALTASVLAVLGVCVVLVVGLSSLRLAVACVLTLLVGLSLTAAFAALAVGELNMISVAFAVLYIGLGVDYAIHFALAYREHRGARLTHEQALARVAKERGGALVLCALTTSVAFYAFIPTSFTGLAELGLIAGTGMFVSLAVTFALMPALLGVLRVRDHRARGSSVSLVRWIDRASDKTRRVIVVMSIVVFVTSAGVSLRAQFDYNPINLRPDDGEAVTTFRELVNDGDGWRLDAIIADEVTLTKLQSRLHALPQVAQARSVHDLIPQDQADKLAQIDDLALLMGTDLTVRSGPYRPFDDGKASQRLAALAARIEASPEASAAMRKLAGVFREWVRVRNQLSPQARLQLDERMREGVLGSFPQMVNRLATALETQGVADDALPKSLRNDWVSANGGYRLSIEASHDLNTTAHLEEFVQVVKELVPQAVGSPVSYLGAGDVAVSSFKQAFITALGAVIVILALVLRHPRSVAMVVYPLLLGAVVTIALMVGFHRQFNFANVIALPLLLGISVDSGIHMMKRAIASDQSLHRSSAPRAILVSALTTLAGFGNLAFSAHPGTASMGWLLTVGLSATLLTTLVVLPALGRGQDVGDSA